MDILTTYRRGLRAHIRLICLSGISLWALGPQAIAQTAEETSEVDQDEDLIYLSPFEVQGGRDEGYITTDTFATGRVVQPLDLVPQRITILTDGYLTDTGVETMQEAMDRVVGVRPQTEARFGAGRYFIRGFASARALRNGITTNNMAIQQEMENIERIEIVKGAASVLYGQSQPGGVINFVTKDPMIAPNHTLETKVYSRGGFGVSLDSTGPISLLANEDGRETLSYRLILKHVDRKVPQAQQFDERNTYFGKLRWSPVKNLSIKVELEERNSDYYTNFAGYHLTDAEAALGIDNILPNDLVPSDFSVLPSDFISNSINRSFTLDVTYSMPDTKIGSWSVRFLLADTRWDTLIEATSGDGNAKPVTADMVGNMFINHTLVEASDVGRSFISTIPQNQKIVKQLRQSLLDLTGQFNTGFIRHNVLLGTSFDQGLQGLRTQWRAFPDGVGGDNLKVALYRDDPDLRALNIDWNDVYDPVSNPDGKVQVLGPINEVTDSTLDTGDFSPDNFYFFDSMTFGKKERFTFSAGVRWDELEEVFQGATTTTSEVTTRFGFVYKDPSGLFSVYGLTNDSFVQNATPSRPLNPPVTEPFGPQVGEHKEIGVRLNLLENKLRMDISYFDITLGNLVQLEPNENPDGTVNFFVSDGIQNKGFEYSASLNINSGTQMLFSYVRNDGKIVADVNPDFVGLPIAKLPENEWNI